MKKPTKKQRPYKTATAACVGAIAVVIALVILGREVVDSPASTFVSDVLEDQTREVPDVIGMYQRKILVNQNGATVWFSLSSSLQCEFGDFDLLRAYVKPGPEQEKRVIVTVEPLDDAAESSFQGHHAVVSTDDFIQKMDLSFTIPYSQEPRHYGVFVCTAPLVSGEQEAEPVLSCRNKRLADFSRHYALTESSDDLFFFSYFTVFRDRIQIMDNQISEFQQGQLAAHLSGSLGVAKAERDKIIATVGVLNQYEVLRTGKLQPNGARFELNLPREDAAENCPNVEVRVFGIDRGDMPERHVAPGSGEIDPLAKEFFDSLEANGVPDIELAEKLLKNGYFASPEEMERSILDITEGQSAPGKAKEEDVTGAAAVIH